MIKFSKENGIIVKFRAEKKASLLHHTATTGYPCCVPALGDSPGAGCVGLARCKVTTILIPSKNITITSYEINQGNLSGI